jgi:hypothetical protein
MAGLSRQRETFWVSAHLVLGNHLFIVQFKNFPGKLDLWKERGSSMAVPMKLDLWEAKGLFFMDAAIEFSGNLALALRYGLLRCWQSVSLGRMYLDGRDPDQFMA